VRRSRRRFLRLLATGSAVAATAPALLARAAVSKRPAKRTAPPPAALPGPPAAVAEELRRQRSALADALKRIRDFPLPDGGEPAGRFEPLGPRRRGPRP
jgi:hypothetical protein